MSCKNVCQLCDRLIISTAVAFTGGNLVITIPAGSYNDNEKYCIVVAQAIPSTTTLNAPVVIQIGTGTVLYPLTQCDCSGVTARNIKTRTKYSTRVATTATSGVFKLLNKLCTNGNNLRAIDGTAVTTVKVEETTDTAASAKKGV